MLSYLQEFKYIEMKLIQIFFVTLTTTLCFCNFLVFRVYAQNEQNFNYEINKKDESSNLKTNENDLDSLIGPEPNFPFLPDNHRDNSNPIKRIGKINDFDQLN